MNGYDLLPILKTFWPRARSGKNETLGEEHDYGVLTVRFLQGGDVVEHYIRIGVLGSALNGLVGAANMSRPPWGWFDGQDRARPLGEWFLQPAVPENELLSCQSRLDGQIAEARDRRMGLERWITPGENLQQSRFHYLDVSIPQRCLIHLFATRLDFRGSLPAVVHARRQIADPYRPFFLPPP